MTESWEIHWKDYYKILQVHPSAEQEVIKAAYDRLARKYHPDVNKAPAANERMKDINEAFEILGDPEKRRRYHSVWLQKNGMSGAGAGSSAPSRPKPTVDPQNIRLYDVKPREVKRASFIIRNTGGHYAKISLSKPGPWVRIIRQTSLTTSDKLPLEVEIEAQGEDWGKSYVDHIIVKLDDVEAHVRIELQTQPELAREEVAVSGSSKGAATPPPQVSRRGFLGWAKWIIGLAILGIILAIVISLIMRSSTPTPPPTPAPKPSLATVEIPQWLRQLSSNPIIPGVGLAGIQLGDTESRVMDLLGEPSTKALPVQDTQGNILWYATMYEYNGLFLGVYTRPDTRTVMSMRLWDDDFNKDSYIPSFRGASVGSSDSQLLHSWGQPVTTAKYGGSSQSLCSSGTVYKYDGISLWVCDGNKLVYQIDIP